jgi:drug/metabolite transporter (DMT)-like permease
MNWAWIGIIAALGSAASWALGSILFKRLGESLSSPAMNLAKQVMSVALLGVAVGLVGFQGMDGQTVALLIVSGVLGIALGDTFFFEALKDLSPVALVMLATLGPALTAVLAIVLLGEPLHHAAAGGIVLVLGGVGIVLYSKMAGDDQASRLRGIAYGLLSVVCMAISTIVAKKGLDSVSALQATFIRMLSGATGMLAFGLVTRQIGTWVMPFRDLKLASWFLGAVCVVTFGGFWLSLLAVKCIDVSVASVLNSTEPVFVLPLALVFLREKITWTAVWGTLITVAGVVLLCQA